MERMFCLDAEETFPSTKEQPGCWLGIAWHVGDCLTFWILADDIESIIARSVIRSAFKHPSKTQHRECQFDIAPVQEGIIPPPHPNNDDLSIDAIGDTKLQDLDVADNTQDQQAEEDHGPDIDLLPSHPDNFLVPASELSPKEPDVLEHHRSQRRKKRSLRHAPPVSQGTRCSECIRTCKERQATNVCCEDVIPNSISLPDAFALNPLGNPTMHVENTLLQCSKLEEPVTNLKSDLQTSENNLENFFRAIPPPHSTNPADKPVYSGPPVTETRSASDIATVHNTDSLHPQVGPIIKAFCSTAPLLLHAACTNAVHKPVPVPLQISFAGEIIRDVAEPAIPDHSEVDCCPARVAQLACNNATDTSIDNFEPNTDTFNWTTRLMSAHCIRM